MGQAAVATVCVCVCMCVCVLEREREKFVIVFFCCLCVCECVFFPRGHQHSGSVLRNSSNYLTFAGINNTCAFSGFILIKPFWSGARPEPAPGKAGRKLVAQDGKSGGQLRAGWEGADEARGPLWWRWTPVDSSRMEGQDGFCSPPSLQAQAACLHLGVRRDVQCRELHLGFSDMALTVG